MRKDKIEQRRNAVGKELALELKPEGFWQGNLSSSALAVAVAITALWLDGNKKHRYIVRRGFKWLEANINNDGSYGDTPDSPGNVSTSLLVYAAAHLLRDHEKGAPALLQRISGYLAQQGIDVHSGQVSKAILAHYEKDLTFSVPILAMSGVCGVPGKKAFDAIPQLPFELAMFPRRFYRWLNLSVVSYAIPALVAVGILIFKKKKSNWFWRLIRRFSIGRGLLLLRRMLPESGGYLEAIPLTAFVCLSLTEAGFKENKVVKKGIHFLKQNQRKDGSWPIDVDLSSWVTSLAVKAFRGDMNGFLTTDHQDAVADHYKRIQNERIHPFNGTGPGGWGWTHFSGAVPDGDDTPGAILSLLRLQPKNRVKQEILNGSQWLRKLQNRDGGFPTFSQGWGKLPFDQSCSDLTGHNLLAVSSVIEAYGETTGRRKRKLLERVFCNALRYLEENQQKNGSWLPLWFGNQYTPDHTNPVYGTAKVVTYLKDAVRQKWHREKTRVRLETLIRKGTDFLLATQNSDGSWGGAKNIPGSMEETAWAISALASEENNHVCFHGLEWLDRFYHENGWKQAPLGLYFASLWYSEKLYPSTAYLEALNRMLEV